MNARRKNEKCDFEFCCQEDILPHFTLRILFIMMMAVVLVDGIRDSATAFKTTSNAQKVVETFSASQYLSKNVSGTDAILKDHNYITADSWIKHFFMRGYKYPLSRGNFSRYEETGSRKTETCTLIMISNPGSDEAKKCFSDSKVDYVMVNPNYDSAQFKKLTNFDEIYNNGDVAVYQRK